MYGVAPCRRESASSPALSSSSSSTPTLAPAQSCRAGRAWSVGSSSSSGASESVAFQYSAAACIGAVGLASLGRRSAVEGVGTFEEMRVDCGYERGGVAPPGRSQYGSSMAGTVSAPDRRTSCASRARVSGSNRASQHHHLAHARVLGQARLDLARLDAETADLYPEVGASQEPSAGVRKCGECGSALALARIQRISALPHFRTFRLGTRAAGTLSSGI